MTEKFEKKEFLKEEDFLMEFDYRQYLLNEQNISMKYKHIVEANQAAAQ